MPSDEVIFRDGLGDRVLVRDPHGQPAQQVLVLRTDLTSVPSFEFAVNEGIWLVERFEHPAFLTIRNILRTGGTLPQISLVSDHWPGARLSEILARAESRRETFSVGAVLYIVKEILQGVADLHRVSGEIAHGALAPERIVVGRDGVRIADYVLGAAIEQLRFSAERYWRELRIAVPASAGGVKLDRRVDVAQVGMIALALFSGRPLRDSEHMGKIGRLLTGTRISPSIRNWLLKMLHMDPRRLFVSAQEALHGLHDAMRDAGVRDEPQEFTPHLLPAHAKPAMVSPSAVVSAISQTSPSEEKRETFSHSLEPRESDSRVSRDRERPADVSETEPEETTLRDTVLRWLGPSFNRRWAVVLADAVLVVLLTVQLAIAVLPRSGTLVIDSNPQGVSVLIDGIAVGVTPLSAEVRSGRHEVELRGAGKPKIFHVEISKGDRVAQFVEFAVPRRR